ncbi:MAG TPA: helix-turn-helix domain-containing protein [Solirubrobacterales bacterium]|nr:helix-turn-helix domain-containing protein [Solirubrobacterales bacterium]
MGKRDEGSGVDQQLARALAHPLRVEILRVLGEQAGSPVQLAALLEEPLGNVSYHTKVLVDNDCIELVETRPARGAVQHFYRAKPHATFGTRRWRKVPRSLQAGIAGSALNEFTTRAIDALQGGTFQDRKGSTITWLPLTVDERGWREIEDILEGLEGRFQAVGERSAARLRNADDGFPVVVAIAAFEAAGKRGRKP